MGELHVEQLREQVRTRKGATGLPSVLAGLHRKQADVERRRRAEEGAGGPDHPWGPGSQPEPSDKRSQQ